MSSNVHGVSATLAEEGGTVPILLSFILQIVKRIDPESWQALGIVFGHDLSFLSQKAVSSVEAVIFFLLIACF